MRSMYTAAGLYMRMSAIQAGLSASIVWIENITPDAYIQVRITNGISWARSGVLEPILAMIMASPMLNTNCRNSAGNSSSQRAEG